MTSFSGFTIFLEYPVFIDIIKNADCQEKNLFRLSRFFGLDGLFRLLGLLGLLGLAGFDGLDGLDGFIGFFEFPQFREFLESSLVPDCNPLKNWNDGVME